MVCQGTKCPDYLIDEGEPAWCYRAGCPAMVAVEKHPMILDAEKETEECNDGL